jgi:hypothetical protein
MLYAPEGETGIEEEKEEEEEELCERCSYLEIIGYVARTELNL